MRLDELKGKLVISEEIFDDALAKNGWSWQELARGDLPYSFDEIQETIVNRRRDLWANVFLKEPDTGDPYSFFDYQLESVLYDGDCVHEDGSEVGKTRELMVILLQEAFTSPGGSCLVGAPEMVYLMDVISACEEQIHYLNPVLGKNLVKHVKHPHHEFHWANRHKTYFSPAGYEGRAFRGKHIRNKAFFDEAAKAKNPDIFTEFWRALKPSATARLYSVPDGDRTSTFYRLCQIAKGEKLDDNEDSGESDKALDDMGERNFRLFNWPKTLQPAPFWSPARKRWYIKLYGGEDSSGYLRNVLGKWGDPENSIFPWAEFSPCYNDIPEYRVIKFLVDKGTGTVRLTASSWSLAKTDSGKKEEEEDILDDREISLSRFKDSESPDHFKKILRRIFRGMPGLLYMGCDLGFSQDPSEFVVRLVFGKTWRTIARVQLKGVTYDLQADFIDAIDSIFNPKGIGVDFGNAGSAVVHILQSDDNYEGKNFDERVTGYMFGSACDQINEEGELITDKTTGKPKRCLMKELGVDLTVKKMQRVEWEVPPDKDYRNFFTSYTYRQGSRHRIFKTTDDHLIDAEIVCTLKQVIPDEGTEDFITCGSRVR